MSYDLYFSCRSGASLSATAFSHYFARRPRYAVKDGQAFYANEDTGVYFHFEEEASPAVASFNLNYFRPPYFGLEAEPEVSAFVAHFDLVVQDPQIDGMGDGDYSPGGFLSGWNAGNRIAHHAILTRPEGEPQLHSIAERLLLDAWRWNYHRDGIQAPLGKRAFVPRIVFLAVDGVARSAAVWPDGIPGLLPEVDLVLVARDELAPRRLLGRKRDVAAVPWPELSPILRSFPRAEAPQRHVRLLYAKPPAAIVDWIKALRPTDAKLEAIRADQVLSAEMLAEARKSGPLDGLSI